MKLNCIILDDEPTARKGLEEHIKEVEFLNLIGSYPNPLKVDTTLLNTNVDLIFLDIEMPKLTGIEFLKTLAQPPLVIFTTAYQEYALQGYELNIVDYLLKPVTFERFLKAVNKAYVLKNSKTNSTIVKPNDHEYIFIKSDGKHEKINFDDILYIEGAQNYCIIKTKERKFLTYTSLGTLEQFLPKKSFIRIHKSYIISITKISALVGNEIKIINVSLPVSKSYKSVLMDIINSNTPKR